MYLKAALNWEPIVAIRPAQFGRSLIAITFGLSFNASISAQETVTAPSPAVVTTTPVESTTPPVTAATTTEANSLSDAEILERLPKLPTAQLQNLLSVYARLKNDQMSDSIMAELNRRAPGSITAEMTRSMRNEALGIDNASPNPYEVEETQIDVLTTRKQYAETIAIMEQLRIQKLGGRYFPLEGSAIAGKLFDGNDRA